jgi:phytoene dehydrogenase-like protein
VNQSPYDAIIVGAGHNGLVAATYLARAGLDVLVLERRHIVGGACATEEIFPRFRVSTCSYMVHGLQDKIVRDLNLVRNGYHVLQYDPIGFRPYPDGRYLLRWRDLERSCAEIARFSQHDADGHRRWTDFWNRASGLFNPYLLADPPTIEELRQKVRGTDDAALLERLISGTLTELLDEHFETDAVRVAHLQTHDMKDPSEPGVLLGIASILSPDLVVDPRNQGLVIGGMGAVTMAMSRAAASAGVKLRLGAEVRRILVEDHQARGVELVDGQVFRSRLVLSNADPKRTFLQLVEPASVEPAVKEAITSLDTDFASLKFHAAVSELPDFSRYLGPNFDPRYVVSIGICPSTEYFLKSGQDALAGRPTRYPLLGVQIPTVYDPTVAPEGQHIVSMWARYYPVHPDGTTWDAVREAEGNRLIDALTEYAPNFRKSLIDWVLYTPADLERRVGLTDGNIHHLSHRPGQVLGDRLAATGGYRTPVHGLYICGAGAHPGGEVTGGPGHNAAHAVLADLRAGAGKEVEVDHRRYAYARA